MTPEELEAFRGWCRTFEVPPHSLIMKALEHIDQQAASLDEAEALTKKNVELMNGYLAGIAERDAQIIHQTGISACRIEERDRLQKQIAALQEIATGERAYILSVNVMESTGVDEFHRTLANHQLSEEHPEAFR